MDQIMKEPPCAQLESNRIVPAAGEGISLLQGTIKDMIMTKNIVNLTTGEKLKLASVRE